MAVTTNFGKSWLQSMAVRFTHPESITFADYRMSLIGGLPALWMILISQDYVAHMNVDHGTLGDINTAGGGGNVFGLATHGTTPGYTGNGVQLGILQFGAPTLSNVTDSSTISMFYQSRVVTFTEAGVPMNNIGAVAFCLTNAQGHLTVDPAPAATQVIQIHEFTAPVSASSSGQTLTMSGGNAILSEA